MCAINEYISDATTYTYRKLQKSDAPECLKKLIPFSNVTNNTLSRLFEGKEIISPNLDKNLLDDNQISEELAKSIQNKSFTRNELNSYLANKKYKYLYLHLNISSISYRCDDFSKPKNNWNFGVQIDQSIIDIQFIVFLFSDNKGWTLQHV